MFAMPRIYWYYPNRCERGALQSNR